MNRKTQTLAIGVALACTAAFANAQTEYTFQPLWGSWHVPANWRPLGGPPIAGDTAIIPDSTVCEITSDDAEVKSIGADGILSIKGRTLTLGDSSAATTSTVDGWLRFQEISGTPGVLEVHKTVTINGGGDITAYNSSGDRGEIQRAGAGGKLTLAGSVIVAGSITWLADLEHGSSREIGVFSADDEMLFGWADDAHEVVEVSGSGTGPIRTRAGIIKFRFVEFGDNAPNWRAEDDGEIKVTSDAGSSYFDDLVFDVTVFKGGTLRFDHTFECFGTLTIEENGGHQPQVIVESGRSVYFGPKPA